MFVQKTFISTQVKKEKLDLHKIRERNTWRVFEVILLLLSTFLSVGVDQGLETPYEKPTSGNSYYNGHPKTYKGSSPTPSRKAKVQKTSTNINNPKQLAKKM